MHRTLRHVELPAPVEPYDALAIHRDDAYVALLESLGHPSRHARYSYLCADPFLIVRSRRGVCFMGPPGEERRVEGDAFQTLSALMKGLAHSVSPHPSDLPPFLGGAVGYFGYEMLSSIEEIEAPPRDASTPESYFLFCHTVLATDRVAHRSWLATTGVGETEQDAERVASRKHTDALRRLHGIVPRDSRLTAARLQARRNAKVAARPRLLEMHLGQNDIRPVFPRETYLRIVRAAKEHIFTGDVFEVCTTQRFDATFAGRGEDLYGVLRAVNEPPFGSYLRFPELEVASSSPERLLSLDRQGWAETRPIKGTRPRGRTPEEDRVLLDDLATSEKDHAENVMIVDLARNDLGRVCEFGSVQVPELHVIEPSPLTYQLVSAVRGRLRKGVTPIDLVRAVFPGGSMTGAPKIEAMKIIGRLEPVERGVFSGSIGFLDFEGALDLNIVIRTFVKMADNVSFHVGGAIVADSNAEDEYQETLDKAHGLVMALELAKEGDGIAERN